jgi:signal transduction histidine kinase
VTLRLTRAGVCLEIADDGQAFDVKMLSSAPSIRGLGLTGMRERVEMVDGVFSIRSTPGKGTTIRAVIPVDNAGRRK